jgi:hypothetical protein
MEAKMVALNFHLVTGYITDAQKGDIEAAKQVLVLMNYYLQNDPNCPEELKKYWMDCTNKLKNGMEPLMALNLGGKRGPKYDKEAWRVGYDIAEDVFLAIGNGMTQEKAFELIAIKHSFSSTTVKKHYKKYRSWVEAEYSTRESIVDPP